MKSFKTIGSIANLYDVCRLPTVRERLFLLLFLSDRRSEGPLEETFLDELVDQAIVHGLAEIKILQVGLFLPLSLNDSLCGAFENVGYRLEHPALGKQVIDATGIFHVLRSAVFHHHLHGESLIVVETLDRLSMGLDESFCNYPVVERSISAKKIISRNVYIVVIGEHCEHWKSRSLEPEIGRRCDQSRVDLTAMKTRRPRRRIHSHRQPLDVLGIDPVLS